jgi:hypothetical protein
MVCFCCQIINHPPCFFLYLFHGDREKGRTSRIRGGGMSLDLFCLTKGKKETKIIKGFLKSFLAFPLLFVYVSFLLFLPFVISRIVEFPRSIH